MEITPQVSAIKSEYMKARSENDTPEMNRLKAKAQSIMKNQKSKDTDETKPIGKEDSKVIENEYGDSLEISASALAISNSDTSLIDQKND